MSKSGFYMDTTKFDRDFRRICKHTIPSLREKGLFEALGEVLHDAINVEPKVPKDKGDLRGSGEIDVKGAFLRNAQTGIVGFNREYAAKVHEAPDKKYNPMPGKKDINWSLPGSGPKFLESKLPRFKEKYIAIVAARIRRGA